MTEVVVRFRLVRPNDDDDVERSAWLKYKCGWDDLTHEIRSTFDSDGSDEISLSFTHLPSQEVLVDNINNEKTFWKMYDQLYSEDVNNYSFDLGSIPMCTLRFFLSFNLNCSKVLKVVFNSNWEDIICNVSQEFSNLCPDCIESF